MQARLLIAYLMLILVSPTAQADFHYDFVRIACIKATRFLDIEYHPIHNSAVDAEPDEPTKSRFDIWAKHGFFAPGNLTYKCSLPESEYKVIASQNDWGNGMCGGAPEIYLSLYKNNKPLLNNIVFGGSCFGNHSITKISIQDGKSGWYAREFQICFQSNPSDGGDSGRTNCEWFFDENNFPIDQKSMQRFLPKPTAIIP